MYRFDYSDEDSVRNLAKRLNEAGKALSKQGIKLLYHNYNCELQKVNPTTTAYDILINETNSKYVNFEFDSYWFTNGGANVSEVMRKLGLRMKVWHINDGENSDKGPYMTPILKENTTELGYGNLDLESLCEIAKNNGIEAVVLETHNNWIDKSPIKPIERSAAFINSHFGFQKSKSIAGQNMIQASSGLFAILL